MGKGVRSACGCSVWRALGKASWNAGCLGCRSKPSAGQAHNSILSGNCPIWQAAPKQVLTTVGRVGGRHHQIREDGCRESSTQQLRDGCGAFPAASDAAPVCAARTCSCSVLRCCGAKLASMGNRLSCMQVPIDCRCSKEPLTVKSQVGAGGVGLGQQVALCIPHTGGSGGHHTRSHAGLARYLFIALGELHTVNQASASDKRTAKVPRPGNAFTAWVGYNPPVSSFPYPPQQRGGEQRSTLR